MADLEPTEAQRLSRLRILLSTAATRLGDNSDAGLHVSTVAIDGAGELAVGLCVHKLGLSTKPITGAQGYRELHRMRNLVQHEGVLPAADQLPRWLAETESMCAHLIEACFKVSLNEVGSSDGVATPSFALSSNRRRSTWIRAQRSRPLRPPGRPLTWLVGGCERGRDLDLAAATRGYPHKLVPQGGGGVLRGAFSRGNLPDKRWHPLPGGVL